MPRPAWTFDPLVWPALAVLLLVAKRGRWKTNVAPHRQERWDRETLLSLLQAMALNIAFNTTGWSSWTTNLQGVQKLKTARNLLGKHRNYYLLNHFDIESKFGSSRDFSNCFRRITVPSIISLLEQAPRAGLTAEEKPLDEWETWWCRTEWLLENVRAEGGGQGLGMATWVARREA